MVHQYYQEGMLEYAIFYLYTGGVLGHDSLVISLVVIRYNSYNSITKMRYTL